MFETYVRDLITSFLGNYFENIDSTPVEISFWRGDIVLRNVQIKSTVMVDFYMPFKIIAGRVGTVTLKVPWSQIYTASVEATLKDLHLIISPCQTAPYNAEEEERHDYAVKMRKVEEIEENRRAAQSSDFASHLSTSSGHYKESLFMLALKNLQLRIDGLHIRYEDPISNPIAPFSFGILLRDLLVHTTDNSWTQTTDDSPASKTFYKYVTLHGLAAYLNSDGNLFGSRFQQKGEMLHALQTFIETKMHTLKYLIGPISTEMKLRVTPNPETLPIPFSLPKATVEISMDQLTLGISNLQFQNLLRLIETVEFMSRGRRYRKFRPSVNSYVGNYVSWWLFAYNCVVSEIRQKRQSWDYSNIKSHRELSRMYCENYYQHVVLHNNTNLVKDTLVACEKKLDVFNIVYIRAQVQVKKETAEQQEHENRRRYGWLANILGWNAAEIAANLETQLRESLSEQEKIKLNQAMGYSESAIPTHFPQEYVAYRFSFNLNILSTMITDYPSTKETNGKQLVKVTGNNIEARFEYRPESRGSNVSLRIGNIQADTIGTLVVRQSPILKTHTLQAGENFLEFEWEKRPMNSSGSRRIRLIIKAVEVIYNANTLQQIRSCFALPKEIKLQAFKLNAKTRLNEYKENISVYVQNWIQQSSAGELLLYVDFDAPYIIIPENGELEEKSNAMIVDMGVLKIQTNTPVSETSGHASPSADTTVTSPEPFTAKLANVKVVMAVPGLENGVLVPIWKRPLAASAVTSIQNFDDSIIDSLVASIRNAKSQSTLSMADSTNSAGPRIINIMSPVTATATVTKLTAEDCIFITRFTDFSLRFNPVSAELFRRISKSWNELDFENGITRFVEDCSFMQNLHDRSSPYVLNTSIHGYSRQMKEGELLFNNIKTGRPDLGLDKYVAHILIGNPGYNLLLVSSTRVFFADLNLDSYGKSTVLWEHGYNEFSDKPTKSAAILSGNGITFKLKEIPAAEPTTSKGKDGVSLSNSEVSELFVPIEDPVICEFILMKTTEAMDQHRLMKACDEATTSYIM